MSLSASKAREWGNVGGCAFSTWFEPKFDSELVRANAD